MAIPSCILSFTKVGSEGSEGGGGGQTLPHSPPSHPKMGGRRVVEISIYVYMYLRYIERKQTLHERE